MFSQSPARPGPVRSGSGLVKPSNGRQGWSAVSVDVLSDLASEHLSIRLVQVGCLSVERVVKVDQVVKERVDAENDVGHRASRKPAKRIDCILSQNAQADLALLVDVGMPDFGVAVDFRRFKVVALGNVDDKLELSVSPQAVAVRLDDESKVVENVRVVEDHRAADWKLEAIELFLQQALPQVQRLFARRRGSSGRPRQTSSVQAVVGAVALELLLYAEHFLMARSAAWLDAAALGD